MSYCGFACAAHQETGLNHLWLVEKKKKRRGLLTAVKRSDSFKNNPDSRKQAAKQNKHKHKTQETLGKNSYEKTARTRKTTSGNGRAHKLVSARVLPSPASTSAPPPKKNELPSTSPLRAELQTPRGAGIKGLVSCSAALLTTKEVPTALSISIFPSKLRESYLRAAIKSTYRTVSLKFLFAALFVSTSFHPA